MPKKERKKESKSLLLVKEQVILSKERTILQFMSTALAMIGLGLVIVNVLRDLLFQAMGFGLVFAGFIELLESMRKFRNKQKIIANIEKQTRV